MIVKEGRIIMYTKPELEVINFNVNDVITTSGGESSGQTSGPVQTPEYEFTD